MTTQVEPNISKAQRMVTETTRRRWRMAALLGLVVLLLLAAFSILQVVQQAQANRTIAVLEATRDIRAGAVITDQALTVAHLRVDDPAVIANLVDARDRAHLVGEVATDSVPAGGLITTGFGAPGSAATMWDVPLPVKRMPGGLRAGDHVALLVDSTARSGAPIEIVAMQDVRVLEVHPGSVDLWLPAAAAAQMQWYADHGGGIALARMQPGAAQQDLRPGGAS
jgi:hypothetical protein